jgi:hypothetical protein
MNKETANEYDIQAEEFLKSTGITIEIKFSHNGKHFDDDKSNRDIYDVIIKRGTRKYEFKFGQSIAQSTRYRDKQLKHEYTSDGHGIMNNRKVTNLNFLNDFCIKVKGTEPRNYDILSCLTKYNPGTFEDFCSEFGYDTDSRKAEKIYNAVRDEYLQLLSLFNEKEMEQLQEIN